MGTDRNAAQGAEGVGALDIRTRISTLWIVVMFNMVFADILGFIAPGALAQMLSGKAGELMISQEILLVFALLLEIPIAMIYLSRRLKGKAAAIANTAACVITSVFVVGGGSAYLHYYFFAGVEVVCMVYIAVLAWKGGRAAR